jgi:SAM-dependent methyltransferase
MDLAAYGVEAEVEATHWWFVGRRRLFGREIAGLGLSKDAAVLDVGTSTGPICACWRSSVIAGSSDWISATRRSGFARRRDWGASGLATYATFHSPLRASISSCPDIIEHVEDDGRALSEIARVLVPGGHALITVPAFESLWGLQDEVSHHLRRYRLPSLRSAVRAAGLHPRRCFHFNYLLFGPIWLARQILRVFQIKVSSESQVNTVLLNRLLARIFDFDVRTARWLAPPFGVSIFMLAEQPSKGEGRVARPPRLAASRIA